MLEFGQERHKGFAKGQTIEYYELGKLKLAPGNAADPIDRSIDKRVERLRRKLEKQGLHGDDSQRRTSRNLAQAPRLAPLSPRQWPAGSHD